MDTRVNFRTPYAWLSTHLMFLVKRQNDDEPTEYRTLQFKGANIQLSPFGHEKIPEGKAIEDKIKNLIKKSIVYWEHEHEKNRMFLNEILKNEKEAKIADDWEMAEEEFIQYITPHLERLRKKLNSPHIDYMHIKDKLLKKYLPEFRLYVIDSTLASSSRIFFVHQTGKIYDMGHGNWRSTDEKLNNFYLPKISDFIISQKLCVENSADVVDLVKMIELICYSPGFVWFLKRETNNFKILDIERLNTMFSKWSIHSFTSDNNWKYIPEKTNEGWSVDIQYVGSPASIAGRPKYHINVDSKNYLSNIYTHR